MNVVIRSASIRMPIRSSLRNVILRPYTTSTSTSTKLHTLAEALKSSKDVSSIHRYCPALATEFKESPDISSQPSPSDDVRLLSILQTLAVSARPQDMRRIEQILHDFYPILGMKPTSFNPSWSRERRPRRPSVQFLTQNTSTSRPLYANPRGGACSSRCL